MTFGERLKELRIKNNLRQADLAVQISVQRATIGKYETNERKPDIDTLVLIANYFDVSTDFLLGRNIKE